MNEEQERVVDYIQTLLRVLAETVPENTTNDDMLDLGRKFYVSLLGILIMDKDDDTKAVVLAREQVVIFRQIMSLADRMGVEARTLTFAPIALEEEMQRR